MRNRTITHSTQLSIVKLDNVPYRLLLNDASFQDALTLRLLSTVCKALGITVRLLWHAQYCKMHDYHSRMSYCCSAIKQSAKCCLQQSVQVLLYEVASLNVARHKSQSYPSQWPATTRTRAKSSRQVSCLCVDAFRKKRSLPQNPSEALNGNLVLLRRFCDDSPDILQSKWPTICKMEDQGLFSNVFTWKQTVLQGVKDTSKVNGGLSRSNAAEYLAAKDREAEILCYDIFNEASRQLKAAALWGMVTPEVKSDK